MWCWHQVDVFSIKLKLITTFEEKYTIWTFSWKQIVLFLHYDLSRETWLVFALLFWNSAAITFHPILNSLCLTCLLNHYYYTFSLNKCCSRNPDKNLQGILLFLVQIRIIKKTTIRTVKEKYPFIVCELLSGVLGYLRHMAGSSWGWTPASSWSGSAHCHGDSRCSSHPGWRCGKKHGRKRAHRDPGPALPGQIPSQAMGTHKDTEQCHLLHREK